MERGKRTAPDLVRVGRGLGGCYELRASVEGVEELGHGTQEDGAWGQPFAVGAEEAAPVRDGARGEGGARDVVGEGVADPGDDVQVVEVGGIDEAHGAGQRAALMVGPHQGLDGGRLAGQRGVECCGEGRIQEGGRGDSQFAIAGGGCKKHPDGGGESPA